MSDRELKAIISATDKASPVFKQVATGADKMGTSIDAASKKGSKGLADQSKSAADMSARMAALGGAVATAAGVLSNWSRSSQEADAIQRQLEASIAATGEEYATYADRIQAAGEAAVRLGQDDEDASQAISALTQITGDANVALDQMGLVMDLAAAKHMSLESAAELVGKVLEGNIGILNRQGFAIDENATATEALAQVQAAVAGQAEASATTYGRLREEFSNITDAIGGTVGEFAPLLAMLPGVSVGFSAVGSAVGALAPSLTKAGAASSLLSLAMGPVGIVAGAAAAAVGIYKLADAMSTSFSEDAAKAEEATKDLTTALNNLASAGDPLALVGNSWATTADTMVGKGADLESQIDAVNDEIDKLNRGNTDNPEVIAHFNRLTKELDDLEVASSRAADFQSDLTSILLAQGPAADSAREAVQVYLANWEKFGLLPTIEAIDKINAGLPAANLAMIESGEAATGAAKGTQAYADALHNAADMRSVLDGAEARSIQHDYEGDAEKIAAYKDQIILSADAQNRWRPQIEANAKALDLQKARLDAVAQSARAAAEALVGTSSFASKIRPVDIDVRGGDKVTGTAADLQKTQSILNSVLGTFQQLDSLGQASEQAGSIATNLIGTPGELSIIKSLLDKGRISQEQYDDALKAGNAIRKESGAIENDLNTIRAKQLPLLAEADVQYGNLIDRISKMDAANAQATIGFMDSTESMKAQNAVAVAAAAAQTEVGSAARDSAQAIIQGAVDADPVLRSMLEQMDLITTDKNGKITINFDNADELNASTDALTTAINNLTAAITGVPVIDIKETGAEETTVKLRGITHAAEDVPDSTNTDVTETGSDSTRSAIFGVTAAVNDIPDSSNTNITASDSASGTINSVAANLARLDNMTATTYINTIVTTFTQQVALGGGAAAGPGGRDGGLFNFATGGVVQLAEAGPEMLRFANGGTAMAMSRGLYAVPDNTLVYNAPATNEKMRGGRAEQTFHFTFNGVEGANQVLEAIKIAAREHFAGWRG